MTQPPSPSAAALKIANGYLEVPYEWRQKLAEEIDAFAAQAVAAERAKPAASDRERIKQAKLEAGRIYGISTDNRGIDQIEDECLAAALAERGERERERAASLIQPTMRPFWNGAGDGIIDGMLDECEQALAAAIRSQTED